MLRLLMNAIFICLVIFVTSCFKEDEQITPHAAGNYQTDTIALTDSYKYQIYYSLADGKETATNIRTAWDFGFESRPSGWRVILNSSNFMKSAYLSGQKFGSAVDTSGAKWLFNPSDGSADSLVIGKWFTIKGKDTLGTGRLLVIDRGIDDRGNPLGFRQLVIDSLSKGIYYFRMSALNGTSQKAYSVTKRSDVNHVLFSITNPSFTISEPVSANWDLLFTQYTTLLFTDVGDPYPYLVTGILINNSSVEVAVDSLTSFASINYEKAQTMKFTRQADRIGYNWKRYDFAGGTYSVNSDLVYVIRDTKGFLFKLRFIGFYKFLNNRLQKGFPSYEYQKL